VATVLMGWEIGGGLGHVLPLLAVARALAERGHQPVFAIRNVVVPWPLFANEPFPVVQAPVWHERPWQSEEPFRATNYADILAVRGWDAFEDLTPQVECWQRLISIVKPRLIVCDHSPTLCLTAHGTVPVVTIGTGFCVPPVDGRSFPLLVGGRDPLATQEHLLTVVQRVQRERKRAVPTSLTEIMAATQRYPTVLEEIDPYRPVRREPTWDPLDVLPLPGPLGPGAGFFAYLSAAYTHVEGLVSQLARQGMRGAAYIRGAAVGLKERLRQQGLIVFDHPASLPAMLGQAAVVIHHGGAGTAQTVLAAGRPQVLVPHNLEQSLTAKLLADLGVAMTVSSTTTPDVEAQRIRQVVNDARFADNALTAAKRIHARPRRPALPAIVDYCLTRLS
jgi:rhamnosyltransferase subunit B